MIGGSLLINALLPIPTPTAAKLGTGQKYDSSPTYSLQGGRNGARLWEPMILIFGKHKVVPDLASQPYTEQKGNDQYLVQTFHFGLQGGNLSISDIRIGDTPITNYEGIETWKSTQDGKLDQIRGNVDTLQGFSLKQADGWQSRTTSAGTTRISVDISAQLFTIRDNGTFAAQTVDLELQYREAGSASWINTETIPAVYARYYWSLQDLQGNQIEYGSLNRDDHRDGVVVYVGPYRDASGNEGDGWGVWLWLDHPYALGLPWQGIAPDPLISPAKAGIRLSGSSQDAVRRTVEWPVPAGTYEVRIRKTTSDVSDTRNSNDVVVNQILAIQEDKADYTGQARLGVRLKASGQLNGAVDELNAIASAFCPVWTGSAWENGETSNPAWWFRWFAFGSADENGNQRFGGGLSAEQVDDDAIKAWGAWCDRKGLSFNYVLDQKMSVDDVLSMIARAGRATKTWQTGKLGVIWDAADLPVTAMYGPFNIRAGTFEITYANDGSVDEIVANFVNARNGYVMDEVRVRVPGAEYSSNTLQLDLDGVTNEAQAGKEANLLAASQVWHRRRVTWETDFEGYVSPRGDVVSLSHDLTVWGYSGRLLPGSHGGKGGLPLMVLDRKVSVGGTGTAMLRAPNGAMKTVSVVADSTDTDVLTIVTDLGDFPMPGSAGWEDANPLDWAWQFDPVATPGRRFKIISTKPTADGVRFEAIDDDAQYYASEDNPYLYTPPRDGALLGGLVLAIASTEAIVSVSADQIRLNISWVSSVPGPFVVAILVNASQRYAGVVNGSSQEIMVSTYDVVDVTITPRRGNTSGAPRSERFTVQGLSAPPPDLEGLVSVFRDGLTTLVWQPVVDIRNPDYEIRMGPSWTNARVLGATPATERLAEGNGLYWVAARVRLGNGAAVYGQPDSMMIAGATLSRNVILERDEAPQWGGERLDGGAFRDGEFTLAPKGDFLAIPDMLAEPDVLWFGGPAAQGIYHAAQPVDIGYIAPVLIGVHVDVHALNLAEDLLGVEDVLALGDILGASNLRHVSATVQVRSAQAEDEWSDWANYAPGVINARYFDMRLVLRTDSPQIIPFVSNFVWTVDVPDLIQREQGHVVPAGGIRVEYERRFHAVPNVQVTVLNAIDGDRAVLTNSDESGFDITVINVSTPIERSINWISQGY